MNKTIIKDVYHYKLPKKLSENSYYDLYSFCSKLPEGSKVIMNCDGEGGDLISCYKICKLMDSTSKYHGFTFVGEINKQCMSSHSLIFFNCDYHMLSFNAWVYLHPPHFFQVTKNEQKLLQSFFDAICPYPNLPIKGIALPYSQIIPYISSSLLNDYPFYTDSLINP